MSSLDTRRGVIFKNIGSTAVGKLDVTRQLGTVKNIIENQGKTDFSASEWDTVASGFEAQTNNVILVGTAYWQPQAKSATQVPGTHWEQKLAAPAGYIELINNDIAQLLRHQTSPYRINQGKINHLLISNPTLKFYNDEYVKVSQGSDVYYYVPVASDAPPISPFLQGLLAGASPMALAGIVFLVKKIVFQFGISLVGWAQTIFSLNRYRGLGAFTRPELYALFLYMVGAFTRVTAGASTIGDNFALQMTSAILGSLLSYSAFLLIYNNAVELPSRQQVQSSVLVVTLTVLWEIHGKIFVIISQEKCEPVIV